MLYSKKNMILTNHFVCYCSQARLPSVLVAAEDAPLAGLGMGLAETVAEVVVVKVEVILRAEVEEMVVVVEVVVVGKAVGVLVVERVVTLDVAAEGVVGMRIEVPEVTALAADAVGANKR